MVEETKEVVKLNPIDEARAITERLEKANIVSIQSIEKLEELKALDILGGKSDAGRVEKKTTEINPIDYAREALKGRILK